MAFVAPFLVAALGLTGGTALVATGLIGVGLAFGTAALARRISPQSGSGVSANGMQLSVSYDINEPRQLPFGIAASAGALKYHNVYGPNGNDYVQLVFKLADVPCQSLEAVYVDGTLVTLGSRVTLSDVSGYTVSEYPNVMWIEPHLGDWTQSADADLVAKATGGAWSSNNRGRGVFYVRVTLKYDASKFPQGIPKFLFAFKGAKLYDVRKDSTAGGSGSHRWGTESTYEWTDNGAVILYNYLRGVYVNGKLVGGMNAPVASLPADVWMSAANSCDESVGKKAGGTEARYRVNALIGVDSEHGSVVRDMVTTMAGYLADSGGVLKLFPGVAQSSVLTITDADIVDDVPVVYTPKLSRSGLVNSVFGSFSDPAQLYQTAALPPRISAADQALDGGALLTQNYGLPYCTSGTQGQRVLEILRRRGRYQSDLAFTVAATGAMLEAGDWVTVTSARYGLSNVTFEVVQGTLNRNLTVPLELREVSPAIFSYSPASDELDPASPIDVGSGGARLSTVTGLAVANVTLPAGAGIQMPGLLVSWTGVTDSTVTGLTLEYRKVGDATSIKKLINDASTGQYTLTEGIQSGAQYEARLDLITAPVRATAATGWVATGANSGNQVVAVASLSNSAAPGSVTMAGLDVQTQSEIALTSGLQSIQGSVNDRIQTVIDEVQSLSTALLTNWVATGQQGASIKVEQATRQTFYDSYAAYKVTVDASLAGLTTSVGGQASAINSLTSQVTAQDATITSQGATIASQGSTLASQGTAITALQNTVNDPTSGNAALAVTTASLSSQVSSQGATITSQGTAITGLQNTVNDPSSGNSALASATSALSTSVATAQATANAKSKTFQQGTTPTALAAGDVWIDTSNGNKMMIATAAGTGSWVAADDARISSTASSLSSLTTTVGNNTGSINTLSTSVATIQGWHGSWSVSLDVNGYVTGLVSIDGINGVSQFTVVANKFVVAQPGVTGGSPVTVFSIGTLNGAPGLGFSGNSIFDGTVKVRHLDANDISTLYINGPDGLYYFDFANGRIGSTDGLVTFDIRNKTLDMSADFLLDLRYNYDSMYVPSVMGLQ